MRRPGASGGEAGRKTKPQRLQSGRQERLDGRFLRAAGAGVMACDTDGQREKLRAVTVDRQSGTPGKSGPAIFAFLCPKPLLGSFTKSIQPSDPGKPSKRTGPISPASLEGFSRLLSEPTPSHRLWAATPSATPALRVEHTTGSRADRSKPELSTLLESGTFYFALTSDGLNTHCFVMIETPYPR